MKYLKFISWVAIFFFSISIVSCSDDDDEIMMWIASEKELSEDPVGGARHMFLYKLKESDDWRLLGDSLEGFEYEEGYEYVLLIKKTNIKNPLQDQSGILYTFIKIISKTKVESAT